MRVIVMGVAGAGKSTLAAALSESLGWPFLEGDSLHVPESVARMRAGQGLTDADRLPWLRRIAAAALALDGSAPAGCVVSCSALRRAYRDVLRAALPACRFVFLDLAAEAAPARLASRTGHFMPASLLASQYATLEPPTSDEDALRLDAGLPTDRQVVEVRNWLAARGPA